MDSSNNMPMWYSNYNNNYNNISYPNFCEVSSNELKQKDPELSNVIDQLSKRGNVIFCQSPTFNLNGNLFESRKRHYKGIERFLKVYDPTILYFISTLKVYKYNDLDKHNTIEMIYCRCTDINIIKKFKLDSLIYEK